MEFQSELNWVRVRYKHAYIHVYAFLNSESATEVDEVNPLVRLVRRLQYLNFKPTS